MSYEIEYSKKAYKATDKYGNEVYVTYVTTCSNNVDPRTPRPFFFGAGQRWEIIKRACEFAGDCESGCWQPGNRRVSAESYIRRWRLVLKDAPPLEELLKPCGCAFRFTMKNEATRNYLNKDKAPTNPNPDRYRWDRIQGLLEGLTFDYFKMCNETYLYVEIPVRTYADVERAIELNSHLREVSLLAWNMEIKF
jgi:hypothetical protein